MFAKTWVLKQLINKSIKKYLFTNSLNLQVHTACFLFLFFGVETFSPSNHFMYCCKKGFLGLQIRYHVLKMQYYIMVRHACAY